MKVSMLLTTVLLIICLPLCASAQKGSVNLVKNGEFERFSGDNPESWDSNNIPGTLSVVSPSKLCNSGLRAVKCEVKDFFGSLVAGYVSQKNVQSGAKDLRLSVHFLLHSVGKDQGVIVLCFLNAGGSTIGTEEEYLEDTNFKFTEFVKEIKAPAGATSVDIRLTLLPGKESEKMHPGSHVICDDFRLVALPPKEAPLIQ